MYALVVSIMHPAGLSQRHVRQSVRNDGYPESKPLAGEVFFHVYCLWLCNQQEYILGSQSILHVVFCNELAKFNILK